jgi:hypothetical protein
LIVVIFALGVFPGYLSGAGACPVHTTVNGRAFCAEVVTVGQPCLAAYGCAALPPPGFAFQGVKFQLVAFNESDSNLVDGWVTEANNTSYRFGLLGDPLGPPSVNWTSPDEAVFVEWRAPFGTIGSDGRFIANVTCGVSFAVIDGF